MNSQAGSGVETPAPGGVANLPHSEPVVCGVKA